MKTAIKKNYDCVKAVRKERDRIAKETEGKTPESILEYFRKKRIEHNSTKVFRDDFFANKWA